MDKNLQCSTRDSCIDHSSFTSPSIYDDEMYIQSRNCFCDSLCQDYGDCCNQTIQTNFYECVDFLSPTLPMKIPTFSPLNVWMRTICLSNYIGSYIDIQCRNLNNHTFINDTLLFIPVTSLETNITYRNYFCAFCNNDANENLQFWEYKTYCSRNGSMTSEKIILKDDEQVTSYIYNLPKNCTKTIYYPHATGKLQPSVFIRPCKKVLPSTCSLDTPIDLTEKCRFSPPAYRYDLLSNVTYHNQYCAECNNKNSEQISCSDPIRHTGVAPTSQRISSLSILFDPNLVKRYLNSKNEMKFIKDMVYSLAYKCQNSDEIYNLFSKKCFQLINSNKEIIISMKCSYPILIENNYLQFNNGSLYLINQSILLTKEQYVFINEHQIVICLDRWKEKFPLYRSILSIICTSISLLCLLIFGIAFCLIPSLHSFPGKCLLFLSISLFIAQITFVSTSDFTQSSSLCFLSAIILHYFYLSSFFWLLIIAIHIHSTFNRQLIAQDKKNNTNKQNINLIAYNIIVWCSSGIPILIACLIQFIKPQSKFSPNYGDLFCSISQSNAMILFFLSPIGCLLSVISILFFKTILSIYHSHKIAKLASSSSSSNHTTTDHNFIFIYMRLASLMGLQWILLIFALIIQKTWAWIIFEIINSLPGVFICFGFLCSQRLWNDIKRRITLKLVIRRQSAKSNTTSTSLMSPR